MKAASLRADLGSRWDYSWVSSIILTGQCEIFSSRNALARGSTSLFLNTDTLFALIKPIHKTAVAIITLSIRLCVFETGIKGC